MGIEHSTKLDPEADKHLRSLSSASLGEARKAQRPTRHWFVIPGSDGEMVAGLRAVGESRWLTVESIWVAPSERGKGLAKQLMEQAEHLAIKLGAHGLDARLYAFQDAGFFKRLGFQVLASLPGAEEGAEKLWLAKCFRPLSPVQPAARPNARRAKREARKSSKNTN